MNWKTILFILRGTMSTEIKAGQTLEVEHTFTGFKLKVSRVSKDKYIIEVV